MCNHTTTQYLTYSMVRKNSDEGTAMADEYNGNLDMSVEAAPINLAKEESRSKHAILARLAELGGSQITEQTGIRFHSESYLLAPRRYESNPEALLGLVEKWMKGEAKHHEFSRKFNYRPWDGAAALQRALMKVFGTTGAGATTFTMFGPEPPRMISIEVGLGKTQQVPWGEIDFPSLEGTIELGSVRDRELGMLFHLGITCPKKFRAQVEGLFKVIEDELSTGSIYRGQALTGAENPTFIDPYAVKRSSVVYAGDVEHTLQSEVWNRIRFTDLFRQDGNPLKRSVLLAGPYGTGKSLTSLLTAQVCKENGWTFIQCRPGQDNLQSVMQTAMLYQPAVVFYEDIDTIADANGTDANDVSTILEMFDGIRSKGAELIVMMTTNHENKIHKGMLRSGRLDTLVRIEGLDESGLERLIKVIVKPEQLNDDVDYAAVFKSCEDYEPAFMRAVIDGARTDALGRVGGLHYKLTTDDLVHSANRLRPQWELMRNAEEHKPKASLDSHLESLIAEQLSGHEVKGWGVLQKQGADE